MLFCTWILFIHCYVLGACKEEKEWRHKDETEAYGVSTQSENDNERLVVEDSVKVGRLKLFVRNLMKFMLIVLAYPPLFAIGGMVILSLWVAGALFRLMFWCFRRFSGM